MAAAMPPSAMTVCALPSRDLHTKAVFAPCAEASTAGAQARTAGADNDDVVFMGFVLFLQPLEKPQIRNHAHR